MIIRQNSKA